MDYYNFYIIKKLLKNKKVRKFLLFIIIFFFILLIKNTVFGFSFTYNNQSYTITDPPQTDKEYQTIIMMYRKPNSKFECYFFATDYPIRPYKDSSTWGAFWEASSPTYRYYMLGNNGSWGNPTTTSNTGQLSNSLTNYREPLIFWSNHQVKLFNSVTDARNNSDNYVIVVDEPVAPYVPPYIENASSVSAWNFTNLIIKGEGLYATNSRRTVTYYLDTTINNGFVSSTKVTSYGVKQEESNNYFTSFSIPRTKLLTDYRVQPDDNISISLRQTLVDKTTNESLTETYSLGDYTLSISQSDADNINDQADVTQNQEQIEQLEDINNSLDDLNNNVEEQTEATEHLENTITDDTVDSGADDLPSVDVSNPAEAPLDNIFMIIYNAFCTGEAQDIVFPIPYTNKNITLSPYYVRDMLNNNGGSWVVTFADAFWQFVIALFVIRDVSKKVNKIKAGDIENIENTNIKEDML